MSTIPPPSIHGGELPDGRRYWVTRHYAIEGTHPDGRKRFGGGHEYRDVTEKAAAAWRAEGWDAVVVTRTETTIADPWAPAGPADQDDPNL